MIATTKNAELTDEELITVLTECEAMLNNRPLTYVINDPNNIEPLTIDTCAILEQQMCNLDPTALCRKSTQILEKEVVLFSKHCQ